MNLEVPTGGRVVKHYPYRHARCWDHVLIVNGWNSEGDTKEMRRFHDHMASLAGVRPDNHEVYAVQRDEGPIFYYWFSDWSLYVGLRLDDKKW